MKDKKTSKRIKAALIVAAAVLTVAVLLFAVREYFIQPVWDYYAVSERAFAIPGLTDGLVPQGIDLAGDVYLVTGYQSDGSASRVYRVDKESGEELGFIILADENGTGISPHAGGLCSHGDYLYVAGGGDCCLYVYSLPDVLAASSATPVRMLGKFNTFFGDGDGITVAFTCAREDRLTVGEFYREPNYPTPQSHKHTTPADEYSQALAVSYRFSRDKGALYGLEAEPFEAYALPGLVQGMAYRQGRLWLSTSYAVARSTVLIYDVSALQGFAFLKTSGGDVPLYALDADNLLGSVKIPPMSEEIIFDDGKMLTMCESASGKYVFGKITSAAWCYATDADKLFDQARMNLEEDRQSAG